jgi:glycosyltransferase involved in cell wall biosynthesis
VARTLSICITTFNRAEFIGATLESILSQLTPECEVVVLDGGSTDNTEQVVSGYARRCERLRYVRQDMNNGFDRDCDRAVELAAGEYCWLMTDDDLMKPGAVETLLGVLCPAVSLVIVNTEVRSLDMSTVVQPRALRCECNRAYKSDEMDRLFAHVGDHLQYVGCVVIRRSIWLARERQKYYGSYFIFVGVIFQSRLPGEALVLADPLIEYRASNAHEWSSRISAIDLSLWPSLIESLSISEQAKRQVKSTQPWRNLRGLLVMRGAGFYSLSEYSQYIRPRLNSIREMMAPMFIALLPGVLVNGVLLLYFSLQPAADGRLQWMRDSRFYFRNWRPLKPHVAVGGSS